MVVVVVVEEPAMPQRWQEASEPARAAPVSGRSLVREVEEIRTPPPFGSPTPRGSGFLSD